MVRSNSNSLIMGRISSWKKAMWVPQERGISATVLCSPGAWRTLRSVGIQCHRVVMSQYVNDPLRILREATLFLQRKASLRGVLSRSADAVEVLFLGRLKREKGFKLLMDTLFHLPDTTDLPIEGVLAP